MSALGRMVAAALVAAPAAAQGTNDPFPLPIEATEDVVVVDFVSSRGCPMSTERPRG